MDTARTTKIKSLVKITNDLLLEMAKENHVELSKYLKPQACKTLNEVYEQALSSLCNRRGMRNSIKFERVAQSALKKADLDKTEKTSAEIKQVLSNFDPKLVKDRFVGNEDYNQEKSLIALIDIFNKRLSLLRKIDSQKDKLWRDFGRGVITSAIFLSEFKDFDDFDIFVKNFQRNKYSREALPMLLDKEIFGFGFALACDFLKEVGYDGYAKPDSHLMNVFKKIDLCKNTNAKVFDYEVFKTVIEVAETVGKTPYEVDKSIWLVCTGNFYYDMKRTDKKVGKEDALIRKLSE